MGLRSWLQNKLDLARREQYARAHPVRDDHYAFAHYKLRQFAQHAPELVYSALDSKSPYKFLGDAWRLPPDGGTWTAANPELSPDEVKVHPAAVGPYPAKIVEMQPSAAPGEADLIAIVWRVLPARKPKEGPRKFSPLVLYYTLEHPDIEGAPPALFEWVGDEHQPRNITLPTLDREPFLQAVIEQVRAFEEGAANGAFFEKKG